EILFNVFIPSFILMKFSGDEHLGTAMALVVALLFPIIYGGMDLVRNKECSFISALGFISVLLTGGIGLLKLDTRWLALKEALIPSLID
ncbi:MFS transporter, partial [Vibrio parahaemolyticus]|nr:MFS transporter [Vibrio parahaemolyticus]